MKRNTAAETAAAERIVLGAFGALTGRSGTPLRYNVMTDTPVGTIGLAASERGLCRLDYVRDEDTFLARLLKTFADRPVLKSDSLDRARRSLDRYFSGKSLDFGDLDVDLSAVHGFSRRVLVETAKIPAGDYLTYSQVARRAGNERASRAAGNALHNNPVAIVVPCHRVLRNDGSLGGYGGGLPNKEWLLQHEGVTLL